jgi:hypothetical protein
MRCLGRLGLVGLVALAACSGSSTSSGTTTTSASTGAPSPASKETAVGAFTLTGDPALTGAASEVSIRCEFPDIEGPSIAVLAKASDGSTSLRLGIRAGKVTVRLFGTGDDGQYHERAFEGSGVTGFDPTKGAAIGSSLTETTATASATPGSLGSVESVKGSVDCREQRPGSATLTLTGDTAEGRLDAATLDLVRVECNQDAVGNEAVVLGILTTGSTKAFVSIGLRVSGFDVVQTLASGAQYRYESPPGTTTVTPTGGHVSGDAVEQTPDAPHVLHVEGDATCGSATG